MGDQEADPATGENPPQETETGNAAEQGGAPTDTEALELEGLSKMGAKR